MSKKECKSNLFQRWYFLGLLAVFSMVANFGYLHFSGRSCGGDGMQVQFETTKGAESVEERKPASDAAATPTRAHSRRSQRKHLAAPKLEIKTPAVAGKTAKRKRSPSQVEAEQTAKSLGIPWGRVQKAPAKQNEKHK